MPSANRSTVGIMAMVAEEEDRMISARTKAALLQRSAGAFNWAATGNRPVAVTTDGQDLAGVRGRIKAANLKSRRSGAHRPRRRTSRPA